MGPLWFFLLIAAQPIEMERAFSGKYLYETASGTYTCVGCESPLFRSEDKYESGAGWPSFSANIEKNIYYLEDPCLIVKRYEVVCRSCDRKLGHVFNDGPPPKNLRYCIPSMNLLFKSGMRYNY